MTALAAKTNDHTDAVRSHVEMLHGLAEGIDGVMVVSAYNVAGGSGTITHHRPGDIDGMVAAIDAHSGTPGANVYVGLHLMKRNLARGKRGTKDDIVVVLGLVADMDADTGNTGALPFEPSYTIETSPGNQQPAWLFDRPVTVAEAAPLAAALKRATNSDHGTADVDHVWRIPGTNNWPNSAKLERGRSPEPASVRYLEEWSGDLIKVDDFRATLAPWASAPAPEANAVQLGDLPDVGGITVSEKLTAMLAANDVGNRSDHAAAVAERLAYDGHSAEAAAALFLSATGNWLARYPTEASARKDFERLWGKPFCTKHAEQTAAGARLASELVLPKADNDNEEPNSLNVIDPSDWEGQPIPERQWYLEGLIPNRQVTLLSGDGGTGKSLLAYQVGLAGVLGIETLGFTPAVGRAIYFAAEDDEGELRRRGHDILRSLGCTWADLSGNMRVIPMAGKDAELVSEKRRGRELELTGLAQQIRDLLTRFRPNLLILDTAADVFGGDEINRKQVRFFVSMLRRFAMDFDLAVLLLSHPSVQGMQTGTGLSGSTAWNNSVRSRLYFTADKTDEDLRLLKNMKANYGRKGAESKLRWHEGAFILDDGKPSAHLALLANHADESFLRMLSAINGSGRRVSSSRSSTYAPTVMLAMPERGSTSKKALEEAMARLFAEKKIAVIKEGPPSKQRERLVVVEDEIRQKRMAPD
ncbi:AAA family ATPase [Bradyrhizobium sp. LA7.1]|uniref:AAA family ATPase n=1 Tax=Bradyrhizobium sp. LA7.1 TaxID=3156324 RepID=UPI003397D132